MQQYINHPSQIVAFSNNTPRNKSQRSHSPNQRVIQDFKDSSQDYRKQVSPIQNGEIETLKKIIKQLQNENKSLRNQLDKANQEIKQLQSSGNGQINQSIFKTTTFELVVLQKVLEQMQQLKLGLVKQNQQNGQQNIQSDILLEQQNQGEQLLVNNEFTKNLSEEMQKVESESLQSQEKIQYVQQKEKEKDGRKQLLSDPSELRSFNSPVNYIQTKGCGSNAYRSVK